MGGQIAVAIRRSNGEIICRNRWTNTLPRSFRNAKMIREDDEYLRKYLSEEDYGPIPVAPHEYGLIVWDFASKHLLSMQNYSTLNVITPAETYCYNDPKQYEEMIAEGRIRQVDFSRNTGMEGYVDFPETVVDGASFIKHGNTVWQNERNPGNITWAWFIVDFAPITLIDYCSEPSGCAAFLAKMQEIDFPVDHDAWKAYADFLS